ncbi:MAG: hypothetical protein JWM78_2986, partial [Verrucomicrobiaceae bacterium]|nr:hypothetical protein [Verrucomicrobiaceae bacterium]
CVNGTWIPSLPELRKYRQRGLQRLLAKNVIAFSAVSLDLFGDYFIFRINIFIEN